ncbi:hypothetical protein Tco_0865279 [Tanacetum coccineum]
MATSLSSGKQITTLNEEISNLSKQLSKEKSTVSSLLEEKKRLKSDFKIREDELLDKQIQLENKIKELDNILYVNGMKSRKKNQRANVSKSANQKKHKANVKKSKKSGSKESLASPSKPRSFLRWSPTGRIFDLCGKITSSSNTEIESDTSVYDNASASNPQEPTNKRFPSSTSFLDRFTRLLRQNTCIHPLVVL